LPPPKRLPMMPWFPDAFLGSTLGWNWKHRALYRALLDAQWLLGSLPNDEEELREIVGCTADEFSPSWARSRAKFQLRADGRIINNRLEEHRAKAFQLHEDAVRNGRKGGLNRGKNTKKLKSKPGLSHPSSPAQATLQGSLKPLSLSLSLSGSDSQSLSDPNGNGAAAQPVAVCPEFDLYQVIFPKRAGRHRWVEAKKYALRLVAKGVYTWQQILDAAQRYADFCHAEGIVGKREVMQAATFLGNEHEENIASAWTRSPNKAEVRQQTNIETMQLFVNQGRKP
jgi:hypothetical protein